MTLKRVIFICNGHTHGRNMESLSQLGYEQLVAVAGYLHHAGIEGYGKTLVFVPHIPRFVDAAEMLKFDYFATNQLTVSGVFGLEQMQSFLIDASKVAESWQVERLIILTDRSLCRYLATIAPSVVTGADAKYATALEAPDFARGYSVDWGTGQVEHFDIAKWRVA